MVSDQTVCKHCGVHFYTLKVDEPFCCKGCSHVYELIQSQGLEHFYDLRSEKLTPVRNTPFVEQDLDWLADAVVKADFEAALPESAHVTVWTQGSLNNSMGWLIREHFSSQFGVTKLRIDEDEGRLELFWKPDEFDVIVFAKTLQDYGVLLFSERQTASDFKSLTYRLGFCGAFTLGVLLFSIPRYLGIEDDFALSNLFSLLVVLLATIAYVVGISCFMKFAFRSVVQSQFHVYLLFVILLTAALISSYVSWFMGVGWLIGFDLTSILVCLALLSVRYGSIGLKGQNVSS